jgi:thiol-disulfide isomerase/thioredoxin
MSRFKVLLAPLALIAVLGCLTAPAFGQSAARRNVIAEVRAEIAKQDFARGESILSAYRAANGVTPEVLEALSWLGRGALAAKQWDKAEDYARQTYDLALAALQGRSVDQEPRLPIALGAAIEVQAHVRAERGQRSEAVYILQRELETYKDTSLLKRIQKNILLLSLEGQTAPAIETSEYLGGRPPSIDELKGKVVLLFFWAHWCPDCKIQSPILGRLLAKYAPQGFMVLAPTQRYGFVGGRDSAGPDEETRYIVQVLQTNYSFLADQPVPLSEVNHQRYGVSTTPTLVLVDRENVVRLYHPGRMTEEDLELAIRGLL